jgi:hypothetical protein
MAYRVKRRRGKPVMSALQALIRKVWPPDSGAYGNRLLKAGCLLHFCHRPVGPKEHRLSQQIPVVGLIFFSMVGERIAPELISQAEMSSEQRIAAILAPTRLRARQALFEAFTLPALDDQTDPDFKIVLITSDRLPQDYRARLDEISRTRPYLSVRAYPQTITFEDSARDALAGALGEIGQDPAGRVVHFRLDDDDALARDFIARLRTASADQPTGRVVSFTQGWYVRPDTGNRLAAAALDYPKISIGLALVTEGAAPQTIYDLGKHYDIPQDQVCLIGGAPAWVRSIHSAAESQNVRDTWMAHTTPENRHCDLDPDAFRALLAATVPALDPGAVRQALRLADPVNWPPV